MGPCLIRAHKSTRGSRRGPAPRNVCGRTAASCSEFSEPERYQEDECGAEPLLALRGTSTERLPNHFAAPYGPNLRRFCWTKRTTFYRFTVAKNCVTCGSIRSLRRK